ncbi:MAG TPA: hypothetical protein VGK99_17745 [Acidobacteriota bacterium]
MGVYEREGFVSGERKEGHEFHKHYRGAFIALSATIISLSSGCIYSLRTSPPRFFWISLTLQLLFGLAVMSGLFGQYLHMLGYRDQARSYFQEGEWPKKALTDSSNLFFRRLDKLMPGLFWGFIGLLVLFGLVRGLEL